MTNLAPRPYFNGRSIGRRQRLLSCRRGCAFSTRASSRAHGCGCQCISLAAPSSPPTRSSPRSTPSCCRVLKDTDAFRNGDWSQIEPLPAWPGNWSSEGFALTLGPERDGGHYVVVINYAENRGQCHLLLPFPELEERQVLLTDLMGSEIYRRDGSDLVRARPLHRPGPLADQCVRAQERRRCSVTGRRES